MKNNSFEAYLEEESLLLKDYKFGNLKKKPNKKKKFSSFYLFLQGKTLG